MHVGEKIGGRVESQHAKMSSVNWVVPFIGAGSLAVSATGAFGDMPTVSRLVISIAVGVLATVLMNRKAHPHR